MTGELLQWLAGFPPAPTTFIIAMLPVIELRGALPIAFTTFDLPLAEAILYAVLGNLIIVPPLYLFLHVFSRALRRWSPRFDKVFVWYIERTRTKIHSKYERWGLLALIIFVATPLPGTGAWTGTVAGWLMGIRLRPLFVSVMIGVCLAAGIVAALTLGIGSLLH